MTHDLYYPKEVGKSNFTWVLFWCHPSFRRRTVCDMCQPVFVLAEIPVWSHQQTFNFINRIDWSRIKVSRKDLFNLENKITDVQAFNEHSTTIHLHKKQKADPNTVRSLLLIGRCGQRFCFSRFIGHATSKTIYVDYQKWCLQVGIDIPRRRRIFTIRHASYVNYMYIGRLYKTWTTAYIMSYDVYPRMARFHWESNIV